MNTANQTPGFRAMSRPQKTAVIVLSSLGVVVIVFWAWQFSSQLRRPFTIDAAGQKTTPTTVVDLHNVDSDNDGLSDYDEINIYITSPYLEDSDSDGISDLKEIQQGTDPNCPQGQNCSAPAVVASSTSVNANQNPASSPDSGLNSNPNVLTDTSTLQNMMTGQIDAATLRQLLIQNGADKASLDKISDEDLMNSYLQTLESQNTPN